MCTLFNFLNFLIAALLFYAGAYSNMLFIAIIILNIIIGIAPVSYTHLDVYKRQISNGRKSLETADF